MTWHDGIRRLLSRRTARRVVIIGAGVTELVRAIALAEVGWKVVVLDENRWDTRDSRSAVLRADDLEALDRIAVESDVLRESVPFPGEVVNIGRDTLPPFLFGRRSPRARILPYAHLREILLERAFTEGVALRLGQRAVGIRQRGAAAVVDLADSSSVAGGSVIGPDSADSLLRTAVEGVPSAEHRSADEESTTALWSISGRTPLRILDPALRRRAEEGATLAAASGRSWLTAQRIDPVDDEVLFWTARHTAPLGLPGEGSLRTPTQLALVDAVRCFRRSSFLASTVLTASFQIGMRELDQHTSALGTLGSPLAMLTSSRSGSGPGYALEHSSLGALTLCEAIRVSPPRTRLRG